MKFGPIYAILYRYFSLLIGSPNRIMGLYIWSLLDMVLWGFFSTYLGQVTPVGFNAIGVLLGAVLLSSFFARVMLNMAMAFFEDMWARNFLNMFASPLRISEYITGLIACGTITSLFGLLLVFSTASLFFDFSPFMYGFALVPFVFTLYLFGLALGIFGCAIVLARGPSSEWFIWPIPAIITPFVGVYYPVSALPHWMQTVATILPPSYVFEGIRAVLAGQPLPVQGLLTGSALSLGYIALASWYFLRTHARVIRNGTIARYSAENAA